MEYKELVDVYLALERTSKRLEKTDVISKLLKKTEVDDLEMVLLFLQGRIYPRWEEKKIGVAGRLVLKAVNIAAGINIDAIEKKWMETGDLGLAAESLVGNKKQVVLFSTPLTVGKVFFNLRKLAGSEGQGAVDRKIKLIAELLTSATSLEAKYIVRTVLEDMRIGVGEGSVRDAIVWAFLYNVDYNKEENDINLSDEQRIEYNKYIDAVQEAYNITNGFSEVALIAKEKGIQGLKNLNLEPGKPIKVMLYQKAKDIEDAFSVVGKPGAEH